MGTEQTIALARQLADSGAYAQAAGMLYRIANAGDPGYAGSMRWNETRGACERASSEAEIRRLFAAPFNAHVQGGTMVIAAEPGLVTFLRAAAESCEWDGQDLVLDDLTGARPWRIRLQRAR